MILELHQDKSLTQSKTEIDFSNPSVLINISSNADLLYTHANYLIVAR